MFMSSLRFVVAMFLSATTLGCGGGGRLIVVNGIQIYEAHWQQAVSQLQPRASADLGCPAGALGFTLVRRVGRSAGEVLVDGCGQQAVYTHEPFGPWIIRSRTAVAPQVHVVPVFVE